MKTTNLIALAVSFILLALGSSPSSEAAARAKPVQDGVQFAAGEEVLPGSSMLFVENAGQWPEAARFQVWGGPAGTMWLAEDGIWITVTGRGEAFRTDSSPLAAKSPGMPRPYASDPQRANVERANVQRSGANIKITFPGANPHPLLEPVERLDTKVSYFLGDDPAQWRSEVPVWGGVRYVDLYPGVDLVVGAAGEGEGEAADLWALQVQEGADTSAVKVSVEGAEAATAGGLLKLSAADREVMLPLPGADFSYTVNETVVDELGAVQDLTAEVDALVVSPTGNPADLLYSTFLGGTWEEWSFGIAVDGSGKAYVTGLTASYDFPSTPGAFDHSLNDDTWSGDAFVVRLNSKGSALEYATFLGGSGGEAGTGIAVDTSGRAYVTGVTSSSDFPTMPGAFDRSLNGDDAFVVRLNSSGSALEYATFLGGSGRELGASIALNGSGRAYVMGSTWSSDFPTAPDAFDHSYNGDTDTFVARLNESGSALEYATFVGGTAEDVGSDIVVDMSGRAYVTGGTWSGDFPTTPGAFDRVYRGYYEEGFVVRLNTSGTALEYATFLGGTLPSWGNGIAVDGFGRTYVTGTTGSSNFPTTLGAFDRSFNSWDAFVVRLNVRGSALEYSTFLGGNGDESGIDIALDASGRAHVMGLTSSDNFPTTPGAFDRSYNGGNADAFVARLNTSGSGLESATLLGGDGDESSSGIALDGSGLAYVTGHVFCYIWSTDFPTTPGGFDRSCNDYETYVAKLAIGMMGVSTKSFQNEVAPISTYVGSSDAYVAESHPTTNYGATPTLIVSGSHPPGTNADAWALLKWDLVSVSGWVQAASLTLNVTDPSGGQSYELYEALGNWYETTASWNVKPTRGTTVLGVMAPIGTGSAVVVVNAAGLAVVQKWLNSPDTNYGFYLMDGANTDTLRFDSSEQTTVNLRPELTVTFMPPVITKGPWVESVTATGATVLWETDIYAKGNINYRVKTATAWIDSAVATTLVGGKSQAKTVLMRLAPNTTYEYRVRASADSAWTPVAAFKTAAAVAGEAAQPEAAPDSGGTIYMPLLRN